MTEIDVPDWVVDEALRAGFLFVCQREGREFSEDEFRNGRDSMDAENRQAAAEMMKAALTAALGAWVVPAGYRALGKPCSEGTQYIAYTHNPDTATTYMLYGMMVEPIYTLRQERPE